MGEIVRPGEGSPFDAIKRTDEHGENWDGRQLMPLLDYDKWENFAEVIEKARVAIAAAGGDPDLHASRRQEASGRARRANYRLTRYGAYIVGMVGDVRKPAVGKALTYFAVKTREAETARVAPKITADQITRRDLAQMILAAEDRADREAAGRELEATARVKAEERIAELEPQAEAANVLLDAHGTWSLGTLANMFGVGRTGLFRMLYDEKILIEKDRRPYQTYAKWFRVAASWHLNADNERVIDHTSYIYPAGALRLHALLVRKGHTELRRPVMQGQLDLLDGGAA